MIVACSIMHLPMVHFSFLIADSGEYFDVIIPCSYLSFFFWIILDKIDIGLWAIP